MTLLSLICAVLTTGFSQVRLNSYYLPLIARSGLPPSTVINYSYDHLNRLTQARYSDGGTFAYGYDPVGNRITQTVNSTLTTYHYDAANHLTDVNGVAYTWDNRGNLLNDGRRAYTYDAANRLTQVVSGSLAQHYEYNGSGDRTRQWGNGVETRYLLDPLGLTQVLAESTEGQTTHYLPGLAQYAHNAWTYSLPDPLGSVRQLIDAPGQVVLAQSYAPFGGIREQAGAGPSGFGYAGEQQDALSKLIYLRARYYDPATGRFLTRAPFPGLAALPQTQHPYVYVGNNPVNLTDPSGEIAPIIVAAGAYIGGYFIYDYLDRHVQNRWGRAAMGVVGFLTGWENIQQDWQRITNPCLPTWYRVLAGDDLALNAALGISTSMGIGSGIRSVRTAWAMRGMETADRLRYLPFRTIGMAKKGITDNVRIWKRNGLTI